MRPGSWIYSNNVPLHGCGILENFFHEHSIIFSDCPFLLDVDMDYSESGCGGFVGHVMTQPANCGGYGGWVNLRRIFSGCPVSGLGVDARG